MAGEFCVECGREGPTVDAMCADCLRARTHVLETPPAGTSVDICRHCGASPIGGHWADHGSRVELVERAALEVCKVVEGLEDVVVRPGVEEVDRDRYVVHVAVEGAIEGVALAAEADVPVKVHGSSCPACSRRHGGYYEAIVQVRGTDARVEDATVRAVDDMVLEAVDAHGGGPGSQDYLLRRDEIHGGVDYYFGSTGVARSAARAVTNAYGARVTESKSIAGKRDGNDVYRTTIAIRLPRAPPGTLVGFEDQVARVHQVEKHRTIIENVRTGARTTLDDRGAERLYRFEPGEVRDLEVVFAEADEAQVLEPDTMRTVMVRGSGLAAGERVRGVKWNDQWWVVPDR